MLSSNADSLVWHWGSNGFSNEPYPTITFDEPEWQPVTLQGYDLFGCGSAPIPDSVYVRPRFLRSSSRSRYPVRLVSRWNSPAMPTPVPSS